MKLYIVATPIGNLKDITLRALETLKKVDLILCEDTRVTRKLLNSYNIKTPTLNYHQHSKLRKLKYILNLLKEEKNLALVCDAGTPGISDPGGKLIDFLIQRIPDLTISPIPGPSAITTTASASGFFMDKFLFLGFPPAKRKRKKFFEEILNSKYPVIFFESPHRIIKTLSELKFAQIGENSPEIVVCRELTKKFETIYRGKIEEVIEKIEKDHNLPTTLSTRGWAPKIKGEFVIIVKPYGK